MGHDKLHDWFRTMAVGVTSPTLRGYLLWFHDEKEGQCQAQQLHGSSTTHGDTRQAPVVEGPVGQTTGLTTGEEVVAGDGGATTNDTTVVPTLPYTSFLTRLVMCCC